MIPQSITVSYAATPLQLKMGDHRALGLVLSHFKNNASFHSNLQFADMDLEGFYLNSECLHSWTFEIHTHQKIPKISSAQVKFSNKLMIKQFGYDEWK